MGLFGGRRTTTTTTLSNMVEIGELEVGSVEGANRLFLSMCVCVCVFLKAFLHIFEKLIKTELNWLEMKRLIPLFKYAIN